MPIGFFKLPFQYLTSSNRSAKVYWHYDSCFIIDEKAANVVLESMDDDRERVMTIYLLIRHVEFSEVVKTLRKYQTGHRTPIGGQR